MEENKEPQKLQAGALGLLESINIGVAGTSPIFSIVTSTPALFATVGTLVSAMLFQSSLAMFGICLAFMNLNKFKPSAGASYTWISEIFHPVLGYFAGWALLMATAIFMFSGTIPAATATLAIISPSLINNTAAVTVVAFLWLSIMSVIVIRGIKLTSYILSIFTAIQIIVVMILIYGAFSHFASHPVHPFNLRWSTTEFTPKEFAEGLLIGLFFFWGWDVTLNLSEETRNPHQTPRLGALISTIIVISLFLGGSIAISVALTDAEIHSTGQNILFVLASKFLPSPWSSIAVIALLVSTLGSIAVTILQFTRTSYAMSRDKVLPDYFSIIHDNWKTPWIATVIIFCIGTILLILSSFSTMIHYIIDLSIDAIGFQVAFYYGLASFACVWHYRRTGFISLDKMLTCLAWPLFSGIVLVFTFVYSIVTLDWLTSCFGIGSIALGIIPYLLQRKKA